MTNPTLHVSLFDAFSIRYNDVPVQTVTRPQLKWLLAYLALRYPAAQVRQTLAASLFPDRSNANANAALRRLFYDLQQVFPETKTFLEVGRERVVWRSDTDLWLDVTAFEQDLQRAHQMQDAAAQRVALKQAIARYGDGLWPGCYEEWILADRERIRSLYVKALNTLIDLHVAQADYANAIQVTEQLLHHDPLREGTYRRLMELHARVGNRVAVEELFRSCEKHLAAGLDVAPSPVTIDLYQRLMAAPQPPVPADHAATWYEPATLAGRQPEWAQLQQAWHRAVNGQPQCVIIRGEAGMGKTHIVTEFLRFIESGGFFAVYTQCYPFTVDVAYTPILAWLRTEAISRRVEAIDRTWRAGLALLLPELLEQQPDLASPAIHTESWQRQQLFRALVHTFLSDNTPLLLVIDDLQWCDQGTLDWLQYLLHTAPSAPLCIVGAVQREEIDERHRFSIWQRQLRRSTFCTEINLGALSYADATHLAEIYSGQSLDTATSNLLFALTEGNPFLIGEAVRLAVQQEWDHVPEGLTDSVTVMALFAQRTAQLSTQAKELLELAAVFGTPFSVTQLCHAGHLDVDTLLLLLDELLQQGIVHEQESVGYTVHHELLRRAVYTNLTSAKRQFWHKRVAEALLEGSAPAEHLAAQVAFHLEQAQQPIAAVTYYQQAATVACRQLAYSEALTHLQRALTLVQKQVAAGASPRYPLHQSLSIPVSLLQAELTCLLALGALYAKMAGPADQRVGDTFQQAYERSRRHAEPEYQWVALRGLWEFHHSRGRLAVAYQLAAQLLDHAQQHAEIAVCHEAYTALGLTEFYRGNFRVAHDYLTQVVAQGLPTAQARTNDEQYLHTLACAQSYLALILHMFGHVEQALQQIEAAVAFSAEIAGPYSQTYTLCHKIAIHFLRDEQAAARATAETVVALAEEYGYPHALAVAQHWYRWACNDHAGVIAAVEQSLTRFRNAEGVVELIGITDRLLTAAAAYRHLGNAASALDTVAQAISTMERTGEAFRAAAIYQLQGELLWHHVGDLVAAETALQQALAIAQTQSATVLALQAADSYGALLQHQGKEEVARQLLQTTLEAVVGGHGSPEREHIEDLLAQWQRETQVRK